MKKKIRLTFILIVIFSFLFHIYQVNDSVINIDNDNFLHFLLKDSNHHLSYDYDKKKIATDILSFFTNINLDDSIDNNEVLTIGEIEQIHLEPLVYIYNTHPSEMYTSIDEEYGVTPNITIVNYILKEKLAQLGIISLVETNSVTDVLQMQNWNYASSYKVSRMFMENAKEKYPSLKYFVDLHRDSVGKEITTTTIDNNNYARILFIVGLENANYMNNLAITTNINARLLSYNETITRGIYKKEGLGVDGVYNQDFDQNAILVEMGGVDNTIDEVYRSTEVLAKVLYDYIGDNDEK